MTEWYAGLTFQKDPADELVYEVDFGGEFGLHNISTANVAGNGVTIQSYSSEGQVLSFKVAGGTAGNTGTVTLTVESDSETPEKIERTINFEVLDL